MHTSGVSWDARHCRRQRLIGYQSCGNMLLVNCAPDAPAMSCISSQLLTKFCFDRSHVHDFDIHVNAWRCLYDPLLGPQDSKSNHIQMSVLTCAQPLVLSQLLCASCKGKDQSSCSPPIDMSAYVIDIHVYRPTCAQALMLWQLPCASCRGKDQPSYSPSMDMGAYVLIINAEKVAVTGKKFYQKLYRSHPTPQPGTLKTETFRDLQQVL